MIFSQNFPRSTLAVFKNRFVYGLLFLSANVYAGYSAPQYLQTLDLENGYQLSFSRPVLTGTYAVPPFPRWVSTEGTDFTITSSSYALGVGNEFSASFTPETYLSNGQPYDSNSNDYNSSHRKNFPLTITSQTTPRTLHFAQHNFERKNANIYPYLDSQKNAFLYILDYRPNVEELAPPLLGTASFKRIRFNANEILSKFSRFVPAQSLPSNHPTLAQVIDELCSEVHGISGYSNLSGGQKYVANPLGTPSTNGAYETTYGSSRSARIGDYIMALLDTTQDPWARKVALACFTQNVALSYLGAALSNFPTDEGGGQGGGILAASAIAAFLFSDTSNLKELFQQAVANKRFSETSLLYRSSIDNRVYYGGNSYGPTDYERCAVGSRFHWGAGNMTYCTQKSGSTLLQQIDFGRGGGYQQIGSGMFLTTAFLFLQVPAIANMIDDTSVVEYTERYLKNGVRVFKSEIETELRTRLLQAIEEHNTGIPAGQNIIPAQKAEDVISDLRLRDGYYGMSHTNGTIYQWFQNHYQTIH